MSQRQQEQRGTVFLDSSSFSVPQALLGMRANKWGTASHKGLGVPPFFCLDVAAPTCASSCSRAISLSAGTAPSEARASCSLPLRYRQ